MKEKYKVLIVGSEGATGRAIFSIFDRNDDFVVFRMGRTLPELFNSREERFVLVDLNNIQFCESIASEYNFDIVIYLACNWRGKNLEMSNFVDNFVPFNNFINTIANSAKHIVYFSSSLVYQGGNFNEVLPANLPKSTYGASKLLSEHLLIDFCNNHAKHYTIFRPFHIVTPYEKYNLGSSHVVTDFIYKSNNNIEINDGNFDKIWTPFTWAKDIGVATMMAVENTRSYNQIFNIGSSKTYSLLQLKSLVQSHFSHEKSHNTNSSDLKFKKVGYFDKSYEILGNYATTHFSTMVEKCVSFKRSEE